MNWEKRQGNCNQRANIINRLVFLLQVALQLLFKKEKKIVMHAYYKPCVYDQ